MSRARGIRCHTEERDTGERKTVSAHSLLFHIKVGGVKSVSSVGKCPRECHICVCVCEKSSRDRIKYE